MEEKLNLEKNKELALEYMVQNIYSNAQLEGCKITLEQTKAVLENTSLAEEISLEDRTLILNLKAAWKYVLSSESTSPSLDNLLELNHYISRNRSINAGSIRTGRIEIAGTGYYPELIAEAEVVEELYDILKIVDTRQRAISFFTWACLAYPFWADNISTANVYANKLLLQNGDGIFLVKDDKMQEFQALLKEYYETGEEQELTMFIDKNCIMK